MFISKILYSRIYVKNVLCGFVLCRRSDRLEDSTEMEFDKIHVLWKYFGTSPNWSAIQVMSILPNDSNPSICFGWSRDVVTHVNSVGSHVTHVNSEFDYKHSIFWIIVILLRLTDTVSVISRKKFHLGNIFVQTCTVPRTRHHGANALVPRLEVLKYLGPDSDQVDFTFSCTVISNYEIWEWSFNYFDDIYINRYCLLTK